MRPHRRPGLPGSGPWSPRHPRPPRAGPQARTPKSALHPWTKAGGTAGMVGSDQSAAWPVSNPSPTLLSRRQPAGQVNRSKPMSAYLFTFRAPDDYAPSADTFNTWAAWQVKLGARLKDRGSAALAGAALGTSPA